MPGPYRCQCNPSHGQSCRYCDGRDVDDREQARQRRARTAPTTTENPR